jgi:E3 ubiquitin-protein ligase HUWE1
MVVSKHVATSETAASIEARQASASLRGSVSPSLERAAPLSRTKREVLNDNFFTFTERHRKILNVMVRSNPALMSGSFSLLVHNPKVLDFDNKRNYFSQQLQRGRREHMTPLSLSVRRQYVFDDSFFFFRRHSGQEIKHGKLNVRFYNEEGIDAGGVTREWFQVLARAMFNPDYALFAPCAADRTTYQPNRMSSINPDHLAFFKFVGRVIGKAIYDGRLLDAYFTRSFYKHILGRPVDTRDLEAVDPEYFKSLDWMLENDITDVLDLNFSVDADEFGETKQIELKEDGINIPVTEANKQEYVRLVTEQRLTLSIRKQVRCPVACPPLPVLTLRPSRSMRSSRASTRSSRQT